MQTDLQNLSLGVLLLAIPIAIYVIVVHNSLARRLQKLRTLAANVGAVQQRRQGVSQDVARHLKHAQRHEQHVTTSGSRRGGAGGHLICDTSNGWPTAGTTIVSRDGIGVDVRSRDAETAARVALHAEAEAYNAIITGWPASMVADAFGFRPWRFGFAKDRKISHKSRFRGLKKGRAFRRRRR